MSDSQPEKQPKVAGIFDASPVAQYKPLLSGGSLLSYGQKKIESGNLRSKVNLA